jgi:hypothetical protein
MASTSQSVAPLKRPLGGRPSTNPIRQYFSYDPASNKSNCLVELNGGRACGKEYEGQTNTTFENHLRSNHRTQYNESNNIALQLIPNAKYKGKKSKWIGNE